jgi:DNA-binding LytR/AlgR family response regulator
MRALVVDDEPIARRRLIRMLGRIGGVTVAGEAEDGEEALQKIEELAPDVVLLDIRMPGMSGLALARTSRLPPLIFTTAHQEHAVEAFEAAAVDYLLKPVQQSRLAEAIARVRTRKQRLEAVELEHILDRISRPEPMAPRLVARRGESSWFVDPRQITLLHASDKYVTFRHEGKDHVLDESLGELETRLADLGFCRVHRGELVNLQRVRAAHRTVRGLVLELDDGQRVPVSRRRAAAVLDRLGVSLAP